MGDSVKKFVFFLFLFSSCGGERKSPFLFPADLCVSGEEERLFVLDLYEERVWRVNPLSGKTELRFKTDNPVHLACSRNYIYLYKSDNTLIQLDGDLNILNSFSLPFSEPVEEFLVPDDVNFIFVFPAEKEKGGIIFNALEGKGYRLTENFSHLLTSTEGEILLVTDGYVKVMGLNPPSIKREFQGVQNPQDACSCGGNLCILSGKTLSIFTTEEGKMVKSLEFPENLLLCREFSGIHTILGEEAETLLLLSVGGNVYFFETSILCELKLPYSSAPSVNDEGEKNNYSLSVEIKDKCNLKSENWDISFQREHPEFTGSSGEVMGNLLTAPSLNFLDKISAGDFINLYDGNLYPVKGVGENYLVLSGSPSFSGNVTFTVILDGFTLYGSLSKLQKGKIENGKPFSLNDGTLLLTLSYEGNPEKGDSIKFSTFERNSQLPVRLSTIPYDLEPSGNLNYIYFSDPARSSLYILSLEKEIKVKAVVE